MCALSPKFVNQMFKPSVRTPKNMGRMTSSELRAEYTKQSKVANKRIASIEKAGYYSPSVKNLYDDGIKRFGIKNQNLMSDTDIKKAYRRLMDFMNSTTSSKTGIRTTLMKMSQNFNMKFDGNYVEFSQKSQRVFDLYEDLNELSKKGELKETDKYNLVHDLDSLYESGELENMSMDDLVKRLNDLKDERRQIAISRQSKLNYNWMV